MFCAMNRITVQEDYVEKFEYMFKTRAGEVDKEPGFVDVKILRPKQPGKPYIVLSFWETEANFQQWVDSGAYMKGHSRAFGDMKQAADEKRQMPMRSDMETFEVFAE
ncbi:antibiotic biosynthesis monooxygenase [bacterium]|nr:antibiotic biosynthesis monooxygenase [bacterium]